VKRWIAIQGCLAALGVTLAAGAVALGQVPPPPASSASASAPASAPAASGSAHAGPGQAPHAGLVVIIYGASWCHPCHEAADYLKARGVPYVLKDIEADPGASAEMSQKLQRVGRRGGSIPVIDVGGEILIGFNPGALDQALAASGSGVKPDTTSVFRVIAAAGDTIRAGRARVAILDMDLDGAKGILDGADAKDAALAIERGRLGIYRHDYDAAASLLSRADLAGTTEGADLADIARGCARGMSATVEVRDDAQGLVVTLQDDDDRALVPLLAETALKVRAQLKKDLGVDLARPLRIDLVRDQFTLAAMTGLPERAAQTTGTVAVAKWGRVTMLTPRSMTHGYPWLDTLAHEMTHLALSQGTRDRAPLWLQEGVAKREETRWRDPQPLDDVPLVDTVALVGMEKGLGRPLDKLGPSIAMLPTAEEASVAFAEVHSFIRFWTKEVGDDGLPRLVATLKTMLSDDVDKAIHEVSGADLATWDKRWRAHIALGPRDLAPDLAPAAHVAHIQEISKRVRLGDLLGQRGHHREAVIELTRAQTLIPTDASVRCWLAAQLVATGERPAAAGFVEKVDEVHSRFGRWWSLHALLHPEPAPAADLAFGYGIALDPLDANVACEEKTAPEAPKDPLRAALCAAARAVPR
jgi:glutaredoxin